MMITPEQQVGKVANNGKFYTPKYWVAKFKTDSDVLIQTARKCLMDCQELAEKLYSKEVEDDELVYITIQITNVQPQ